jgi:hypothetical protein
MPDVRLSESASVKLSGSGSGTAKVGPISAREQWRPENVHVSVSTATAEAACSIYIGDSVIARNFRDTTFSGSSGDSSDRVNADRVNVGEYVWAVWTGGDPNATGTLTVTGTKTV